MKIRLFTGKWIHINRFIIILTICVPGIFIAEGEFRTLLFYILSGSIFYSLSILLWEIYIISDNNKFSFLWVVSILDGILITILVYGSGGIYSQTSLLYLVHIASSGMLLYTRGSFVIASIDSLLYTLLGFAIISGILPDPYGEIGPYPSMYVMRLWFIRLYLHILVFFLVAAITSYLSDRLKERKEEIEHLEELINKMLESLKICIFMINSDGNIVMGNKACSFLFDNFKIGRKVYDIIPSLQTYKDNSFVMDIKDNRRFLYVNKQNISQGNTIFFIEDITNRRLKEKLAVLGEMMSDLAHEIRNPLSSVRGIIEVIVKNVNSNDEDIKKLSDILMEEIDRVNSIIDSILNYSRMNPVYKENTNLMDILNEVVNLVEKHPAYKKKNPEIRIDIKDNLSFSLDRSRFFQMMYNLIINAIEHNDSTPPVVDIFVKKHDKSLMIRIKDNGKGIKKEFIERIFDPFFSTNVRGTGIGLAIVKKIVEDHNGEINVKSEEGRGSEFIILLKEENDEKI